MGSHLSTPCKVIEEESGAGNGMQFVAAGMQGWRRHMEDAHISKPDISSELSEAGVDTALKNEQVGLFAVFDGHGGKEVARFCEDFFVPELIKSKAFAEGNFSVALAETFHRMDEMLELPEYEERIQSYRHIPNPSDALRSGQGAGAAGRGGGAPERGLGALLGAGPTEAADKAAEGKKLDYLDAIALFKALLEQQRGGARGGGPSMDIEYDDDDEEEEAEERGAENALEEEEEDGDDDGQPRVWEMSEIEADSRFLVDEEMTEEPAVSSEFLDEEKWESEHPDANSDATAMALPKDETEEQVASESVAVNEELLSIRSSRPFKLCEGDQLLDYTAHSAIVPKEQIAAVTDRMCRLQQHKLCAGCTAVVALRVGNKVYVANAGDSRAVLSRDGAAVALSLDHKPFQQREFSRIQKAGGFVTPVGRVNGNLNLSRAIGDLKYKKVQSVARHEQIITAEPDISVITLLPEEDEFLLLACDGVWDVFTNQEAVDFVRERLQAGMSLSEIVAAAFEHCICQDPKLTNGTGSDNMTLIIVTLRDPSTFRTDAGVSADEAK